MASREQYEVWIQNGVAWEMIAWFSNLELAWALTAKRSRKMRLVHALYEDGKQVSQEVLAEVGILTESST